MSGGATAAVPGGAVAWRYSVRVSAAMIGGGPEALRQAVRAAGRCSAMLRARRHGCVEEERGVRGGADGAVAAAVVRGVRGGVRLATGMPVGRQSGKVSSIDQQRSR